MKVDQKTKRKLFFVNHNNTKIVLQTPKMFLPNGVKHWASETYPESFEMEMVFDDTCKEFHEKMIELDNKIKSEILKNPKDWVNNAKVKDIETIEAAFYVNPIVRNSKDKEGNLTPQYNDKMKVKLERYVKNGESTGRFVSNMRSGSEVLVFDENNNQLDFNDTNCEQVIPKGCKAVSIIEFVNINIVNGKVYPKWRLVQTKVYRNKTAITTNIIEDEDEEELTNEFENKLSVSANIEENLQDDLDSMEPKETPDENEPEEVIEQKKELPKSKKVSKK